jgi:YidC/Oxa1 family membrane protein insertase
MLPVLEFFHKMTHSYGWSIVLLTVFVRILVWPLVAQSTRSMQKMSKLQPQLKAIQDRYKDDPELFQKKAMEFYAKNKVNPMSGCLPTLVQLPILFALFATFTGPPFGDKPIDVKVKVVAEAQQQDVKRKETSDATSCYVSPDGAMAKIALFPGESTVVKGTAIDFGTRALKGELPADFKVFWKVVPKGKDPKTIEGVEEPGFHAEFPDVGEYVVEAKVRAIAKNDQFYFVNSLGKVAKGLELLQPENVDTVILILLFGVTMFLSQKFTVNTPKPGPDEELTEQQLIQQQTMKTMPIAVTVMFFFIPLPTGVYLYMVVSNVIQTLQTWIIMKSPAPALVDVLDEEPEARQSGSGGAKTNNNGASGKSNDNGSKRPKKTDDNGKGHKIDLTSGDSEKIPIDGEREGPDDEPDWKRKSKKKKKK